MKIKVIMTGSDGNCIHIAKGNTSILLDAGFKTQKKMKEMLDFVSFDAIVVSHEHTDHFSTWTGRLAIERNIPIYLHKKHYEAESERKTKYLSYEDKRNGQTYVAQTIDIEENVPFSIQGLHIEPFTSYHDAKKTLGFLFPENSFCLLTDCGFISKDILKKLKTVKHLALEFNYEEKMLVNGERHAYNKLRTLGKFGHLNIEEAIKVVKQLPDLETLITLHSSEAHCDLQGLKERLTTEFPKLKIYVSERENNEEIHI